jgi:thymidylate synthase
MMLLNAFIISVSENKTDIITHMKKYIDTQYETLLEFVLKNGSHKSDRTGVGTTSYFSPKELRYDMSNGLPVITTKSVYLKGVIHELLWFISGNTNIKYLQENNVHIWDAWDKGNGDLGPVYGAIWRHTPNPYYYMSDEEAPYKTGKETPTIDILGDLIETIKTNPHSRRLILPTYFEPAVPYQALPPCHSFGQFYVNNGKISFKWYQRSSDLFLGLPFNIASYALLLHMVAQVTGYEADQLVVTFGDAHIYDNHREQVETQLARKDEAFLFPELSLNKRASIDDYVWDDFRIEGYQHHPGIKAPVAV